MNKTDIKRIVYNHLKDDYYTKLRALESDVEFFTLYMKRNQKSEFRFDLRISQGASYKAFDHIWGNIVGTKMNSKLLSQNIYC